MQSGPAKRDIFERPPKEFRSRGKMWKLLRLPYGIVESGRQWLCTIEDWMLNTHNMERVHGIDQLFILRRHDKSVVLLAAKVVDDLFLSGTYKEIKMLYGNIGRSFKLGFASVRDNFKFLGCYFSKSRTGSDISSVSMNMDSYLRILSYIQLSKVRRASSHLLSDYR